ncbi:two component transcriptional regulator, LuxR family [Quadrisphaera granulorum]|uniref:LuxR family two component transcriptional regulator n=1 Tax=Quadrisphaera granulorum TaxID=317664 RepID=A0A315ZW54_9ACTN|nr:response regulator transcription factor [Quadrisphaera granulorum]PWJ49579.1 LuxR family two component transcriptional regulator [Quadrisphaera granulorum]SZE98158.1 two component transcriptional regulator, LuxR family [Quadrisphaera granulorum]
MTSVERDPLVRVLVVDDQSAVREGLVALLGLVAGVHVVGEAADGALALDAVAGLVPDVVLMDLRMPHVDGVEATARIVAEHPGVAVVVLTTYADDESVLAALRAGARGFLTKSAGRADIARALHAAAAGQLVVDGAVQAALLGTTATSSKSSSSEPPAPSETADLVEPLTPRESEVLELLAQGLSNAQIARRLVVSMPTVKTHVAHVLAKTGSADRREAAAWARSRV